MPLETARDAHLVRRLYIDHNSHPLRLDLDLGQLARVPIARLVDSRSTLPWASSLVTSKVSAALDVCVLYSTLQSKRAGCVPASRSTACRSARARKGPSGGVD